jgi:hypothetical protein
MPANITQAAKKKDISIAYYEGIAANQRPRSVFSLLHEKLNQGQDLEHPNAEKEMRIRMGESGATSCGVLLQEIQGQNFSPEKWLIFVVLELKTRQKGGEALRKKGWGGWTRIYSHRINGGGHL